MESVFYGLNNESMDRKDLIEKIMKVAEHYKNGDLYATGAMTDVGILVDEYTETVVKNYSILAVVERSEQFYCELSNKTECQSTGVQCPECKEFEDKWKQ